MGLIQDFQHVLDEYSEASIKETYLKQRNQLRADLINQRNASVDEYNGLMADFNALKESSVDKYNGLMDKFNALKKSSAADYNGLMADFNALNEQEVYGKVAAKLLSSAHQQVLLERCDQLALSNTQLDMYSSALQVLARRCGMTSKEIKVLEQSIATRAKDLVTKKPLRTMREAADAFLNKQAVDVLDSNTKTVAEIKDGIKSSKESSKDGRFLYGKMDGYRRQMSEQMRFTDGMFALRVAEGISEKFGLDVEEGPPEGEAAPLCLGEKISAMVGVDIYGNVLPAKDDPALITQLRDQAREISELTRHAAEHMAQAAAFRQQLEVADPSNPYVTDAHLRQRVAQTAYDQLARTDFKDWSVVRQVAISLAREVPSKDKR